tara:strand:+ start:2750 stop:2902 length:153 start_codon:yes stop_codon:yes gene_type:complete
MPARKISARVVWNLYVVVIVVIVWGCREEGEGRVLGKPGAVDVGRLSEVK